MLWGLFDLLAAGNPLHSSTETRQAATRIGRPQAIDSAITLAPEYGAKFLQVIPTLIGPLAAAAALRWDRRRALLPVAIAAVGVGAFLVLGLGASRCSRATSPFQARCLALFCAAAERGVAGARRARTTGPLGHPGVGRGTGREAWGTADVVPTVRENLWFAAARHRADGDLPGLSSTRTAGAFRRCPPQQVSFFQTRPLLAYLLGVRTNSIVRVRASRPVPGNPLLEREADEAPPHTAFGAVAQSRYWRLLSTCRPDR